MKTTLYISEEHREKIKIDDWPVGTDFHPLVPGELYICDTLIRTTTCGTKEIYPSSGLRIPEAIDHCRYWKVEYEYDLKPGDIHQLQLVFKEGPMRDVFGDPVEPGPGRSFTVVLRGEERVDIPISALIGKKIYDPQGEIKSNGSYKKGSKTTCTLSMGPCGNGKSRVDLKIFFGRILIGLNSLESRQLPITVTLQSRRPEVNLNPGSKDGILSVDGTLDIKSSEDDIEITIPLYVDFPKVMKKKGLLSKTMVESEESIDVELKVYCNSKTLKLHRLMNPGFSECKFHPY